MTFRPLTALAVLWIAAPAAAEMKFIPRELFRIPFGDSREQLGVKVEGDQVRLPHEFTRDRFGRLYINDSAKRRLVRYSPAGAYEMSLQYASSVRQVFSHADENGTIWLLLAHAQQGVQFHVYDARGKEKRSAVFSQYNRFRLHVADDGEVLAILSSDRAAKKETVFSFDTERYGLKRLDAAPPPEGHHQLQTPDEKKYRVDRVPGDRAVYRITEGEADCGTEIAGDVIYMTAAGEIYTRTGPREIRVYDLRGRLLGGATLIGLSASAQSIRFDEAGNLYQLDGIPDRTPEEARRASSQGDPRPDAEDRRYTAAMPGMRLIQYQRQ